MNRPDTAASAALRVLVCGGLLAVVLACGTGVTLLCADLLRQVGAPVLQPILSAFGE